jgi:hypothetical protein
VGREGLNKYKFLNDFYCSFADIAYQLRKLFAALLPFTYPNKEKKVKSLISYRYYLYFIGLEALMILMNLLIGGSFSLYYLVHI